MLKSIAPMWQKLRHLPGHPTFAVNAQSLPDPEHPTTGQRLAERVAGSVGSWWFLGGQGFFLILWLIYNTIQFTSHFDGPPYILLNLLLSFQAAFTGPVLLIAANAGAVRDHKQANRVEQLVTQNEQLEERNKSLVERLVNVEQLLEEHVRSSLELHTAELRDLKSLLQDVHATLGCGAAPGGSVSLAAMPAATSGLTSGDPAPDLPASQPAAERQRPTSGRSQRRERR